MIGTDQLSQPPPSPVNDPRGAAGMGGGPGAAGQPSIVAGLVGSSGGGSPTGLPPDALQGVLQLGQQMTEQIKALAQTIPVMAPKLAQAITLIEQALADFVVSGAGGAPVPMGGSPVPGAMSTGQAFPRM